MQDKERIKIFITDDDKNIRDLMVYVLSWLYECQTAESGEECLATIEDFGPDLVILDVCMGGIDGYETCRQLKKNKKTSNVPVLFASAKSGANDQLKAYQSGGDGYIVKPIDPKKILTVVEERLKIRKEYRRLELEAHEAMQNALEAMTNSSELGRIIQFVDGLNAVEELDILGNMVLEDFHKFGLICSIQIRTSDGVRNMGNGCADGSFEAQLLSRVKDQGRYFNLGQRTFVNYSHISILIKNMPVEDQLADDRIRDHLSFIANAASNRVRSIDLANGLKSKKDESLNQAVILARGDLEQISGESRLITDKVSKMLAQMRNEMEDYLFSLGLSDEQEEAIMQVFDKSVDDLTQFNQKYQMVDDRFSQIMHRFSKLAVEESKMEKMGS